MQNRITEVQPSSVSGHCSKPPVGRSAVNTFIKPSKIHGLGLFANRHISKGEEIIQADKINLTKNIDDWIAYNKKAKVKSMTYEKGYCMVNHSDKPNTVRGEDFGIFARRDILSGEEITEDYNALPDEENPFKNNIEEMIFRAAQLRTKFR